MNHRKAKIKLISKGNKIYAGSMYPTTDLSNIRYQGWNAPAQNPDSSYLPVQDLIVNQSQHLWNTDSLARSVIETPITQGLNTGLRPKSIINYKYLGLTYEQATEIQKQIDFIYKAHTTSDFIDYNRRFNFAKLQEVVLREKRIEGDLGIIKRYKKNKNGLGTCIQLVTGPRIRTPERLSGNPNIRAGIKFHPKTGEPLGYYIADKNPKDTFFSFEPINHSYIPSRTKGGNLQFLLSSNIKLLEQSRGMPELTPLLESLKEIKRLKDSELQQSVNASQFGIVELFDPKTEALISDGIEDYEDDEEEDQEPLLKKDLQKNRSEIEDTTDPAFYKRLPNTHDVKSLGLNRPNPNFDPFYMSMARTLGSAIGIPQEILQSYFSSSYSASRASFLIAKMLYQLIIQDMIDNFVNPVRNWILEEAIAKKIIKIPHYNQFFTDPYFKAAYLACDWTTPYFDEIDRVKSAKSDELDIQNGIVSRRSIRRKRNIDDIAMEEEIMEEQEKFGPLESRDVDKAAKIEDGVP